MAKRWRIYPHDPDLIASLQRASGISSVIAQLLVCRGIFDPKVAREFLDAKLSGLHDPETLPGANEAAQQIFQAIRANRRIVIYGDYDVDGMSGTVLLLRCLKMLGAEVDYYVPNRLDEGYGLNDDALRTLAGRETHLVVSVDCGITSVHEAQTARNLGLGLIITDHHAMAESLPEADVLVHPRLPGSNYPFGELCGAGVALKLAWALCQQASDSKKVGQRMKDFLMQSVGLAALGTVADVVPLVDENRLIVRHGLASLRQQPTPGIAALMKITKLDQKPHLSSEDIAFTLAPRMNAAGRLGQARLGVELLATDDPKRAQFLAEYIHELNSSRQSLERSIHLAANKQAQKLFDPAGDSALVLAQHDWHPGVIGIVAGRLAEKYHRPVILISLDPLDSKPGVGSARSVPGFNLHKALKACSGCLVSHGGHAAAAGLKIEASKVEQFRNEFCEYAAGEIPQEDRIAELSIDAETPLSSITLETVNQINRLAPFGAGNVRPVLCATGVSLDGPTKRMGESGRHLSMWITQHGARLRVVAFGGGEWEEQLNNQLNNQLNGANQSLAIAFQPVINQFRGRRSVELHLKDWRVAEPAAVESQCLL